MTKKAKLAEQKKNRLKDKIITDFYNTGIMQKKVLYICFKNHIGKDTYIAEDVEQEMWMHLSKKSADEIIDMYTDSGNKPKGHWDRLVGLCTTIAIWKGVSTNPKNKEYPKHSLANFILYGSNLNLGQPTFISPTDSAEDHEGKPGQQPGQEIEINILDKSSDENTDETLWQMIRERLDDDNLESLDYFINLQKKQGRFKDEVKEKYIRLLDAIKTIINKEKIFISTPISKGYKKETFARVEQKESYIMTQEQTFQNIDSLMVILSKQQKTGKAKINADEKKVLKKTYQQLMPGAEMDLDCPSCILHYLTILQAYYQREKPKYDRRLAESNNEPDGTVTGVIEPIVQTDIAVKPKNKAGRKSKKKNDS